MQGAVRVRGGRGGKLSRRGGAGRSLGEGGDEASAPLFGVFSSPLLVPRLACRICTTTTTPRTCPDVLACCNPVLQHVLPPRTAHLSGCAGMLQADVVPLPCTALLYRNHVLPPHPPPLTCPAVLACCRPRLWPSPVPQPCTAPPPLTCPAVLACCRPRLWPSSWKTVSALVP